MHINILFLLCKLAWYAFLLLRKCKTVGRLKGRTGDVPLRYLPFSRITEMDKIKMTIYKGDCGKSAMSRA
jgi:hypothetical protein